MEIMGGMINAVAVVAISMWVAALCLMNGTEAWIKFRKPAFNFLRGEAKSKVVFKALDNFEIFMALLIVLSLFFLSDQPFASGNLTFFIPVCILMLQKLLFMPALGRRVELITYRSVVPVTMLPTHYLLSEAVKITSLLIFSLKLV